MRADSFWQHVRRDDAPGACWLWTARRNASGYGLVEIDGVTRYAHRVAYSLHHGKPIPQHLRVRHRCDVRACCRPEHLELGTQSENERDKVHRGRARLPEREQYKAVVFDPSTGVETKIR